MVGNICWDVAEKLNSKRLFELSVSKCRLCERKHWMFIYLHPPKRRIDRNVFAQYPKIKCI